MIGGGADGGILPMIGGLGVGILFSIILASFGAAVTAGLGSLILLALAAIVLAITAYYLSME
ncbi:Uncharacterised protein [Moraxella caprae]|uniref:Uncharacterized protein n=2 Tax=Moraxella caprae TaxID=90240 RepID=A0A378R3H0_9GAMM|nr:Uncharacterised protein [Moraxella caprae]